MERRQNHRRVEREQHRTGEHAHQEKNHHANGTGVVCPENFRPPNLTLDRLPDASPDGDDARAPNCRDLEVLHEEGVVTDGPSEFAQERGSVDVLALEHHGATPYLVSQVDAQ